MPTDQTPTAGSGAGDSPAAPPPDMSSLIYDVEANDPAGTLVDRTGVPADELAQITELMHAVAALRVAEQELADASRRYMALGASDMRALHFLIVSGNRGVVVTPGAIAQYLRISSAATTKLLDRLERDGHIERHPHPTDRRALAISITPSTRESAMRTVGAQQARRFLAAAALTKDERDVVIRFLRDMTRQIRVDDDPWPSDS